MADGTLGAPEDIGETGALTFDAPGPGTWLRDRVHMPRPWSRYQQELFPPALVQGFRAAGRRYGWLLDHLEFRFVHGFAYFRAVPVEEIEAANRIAAAEQALETRVWREDAARWEREIKPAAVRAHLAIQAVDPSVLPRAELLAHLQRCRNHQQRMTVQHHTFNGVAFAPIGDLIAHACDWTGLEPARIIALARGAAPESIGSSAELDRLVAALRRDAKASTTLAGDEASGLVLKRLRALAGDAGETARAYLDSVSYRLLDGFDVGDPYALEVPALLVRRVRHALQRGEDTDQIPPADEIAYVRDRVPSRHRDDFDSLLAEARLTSRVRDERGIFSDVWAGGLTRRAILAAGEVLERDGRIAQAVHLAEADFAEMRALLLGTSGPSAEELARRAHERVARRMTETPDVLGDLPESPPSLDALPATAARANRAIDTAIRALYEEAEVDSEPAVVRGVAASPGTYTGTARVINAPADFARLQQGDVLVTVSTTEAFNTVVPLLGALVTDAGGLLSHAAIVSREYGIPGVVGTRDATTLIKDGALVRVAGDTGVVHVLP